MLVPYVFSFRCVCYFNVIYIFSCRVCRYDLCVRFCDGNSVHAVVEYQRRFPNRRIPTRRVFTRVYQTLGDTRKLTGVRIAAERGVNEGVEKKKALFRGTEQSTCEYAMNCKTSSCSPHESVGKTASRRHVTVPRAASAKSRTWRFCTEARILQVDQWQSPVAALHPVY